jgi:hypothetical protein
MSAADLLRNLDADDRRRADLKLAVHETLAVLGARHEWDAHTHRRLDLERGIISHDYAIALARGTLRQIQDYLRSLP